MRRKSFGGEASDTEVASEQLSSNLSSRLHSSPPCDLSSSNQASELDLGTLYEEHARPMAAALRKLYGDGPPDPEDISQLAFQKVIERGNLGAIGDLKAYLWRTARNLLFKAHRSAAVSNKYDRATETRYFAAKSDVLPPERVISARQELALINQALRDMPSKRRRAFIMHRIDGLPVAEVARQLGLSRSTTAQHVARAVAELNHVFLDNDQ